MNYTDILDEDNENVHIILLEKELYSKSTILKTCYKFTDKAYLYINTTIKNNINLYRIYYKNKEKNTIDINEFMNELLDQELRGLILNETKKIRNAIVSRALLSGRTNDY